MRRLTWRLLGMRVTALVGRSGTGKSFRAQLIATRLGIDLIVDDGLLIQGQKILAGTSAKVATNAMAAVKAAVFHHTAAATHARHMIADHLPRRVLVLGTSVKMVRTITRRLALPNPQRILTIEDIATTDEIEAARTSRVSEGKHIIPVPPVEVRRDYAHMVVDAIKIFWRRGVRRHRDLVFEKTVVRNGGRGTVSVSEAALTQMVAHCVLDHDTRVRLARVVISKSPGSWSLEAIVDIPVGVEAVRDLHALRDLIFSSLERHAGIVLRSVDITVGNVVAADDPSASN